MQSTQRLRGKLSPVVHLLVVELVPNLAFRQLSRGRTNLVLSLDSLHPVGAQGQSSGGACQAPDPAK